MSLLVTSAFARDVARLLAGWLACIVFVQATASAVGGVQGPRHVHLRVQAEAAMAHEVAHELAHEMAHDAHGGWARHAHHDHDHGTAVSDEARDLGAAAGLVLSAMVALGAACGDFRAADVRHVLRDGRAWSATTAVVPLPERPPRG